MKIKLKKIINFSWKKSCNYFIKQLNVILFLIAFLLSSYCIYFWYRIIYKPGWSSQQKQSYIKSKEQKAVFNKGKFEKIVAEYLIREEKRKKLPIKVKDIFQIKK